MNQIAPFTVKQREYLSCVPPAWFNVAEGGKRGGKNVLNTLAFCLTVEGHTSRIHLIAGVSTATARLNILDCDGYGLLNYFEGRCRAGQYQNRDCLYISTLTGEKIILVSGGGKAGDEKLIKGNTYGCAYVTEANECAPDFLREVFDRTLSSKDRKIFHDLNPKAPGHWYYTDILPFHEKKQAKNLHYGYNYGHFTIADNMSVSDEQLKEAIGTYDPDTVWYRRDILGLREQAEGLIYTCFNPALHKVPTKERAYDKYYISCDYGTVNPFSCGLWGRCGGKWYRMAEYYFDSRREKRQQTDAEYYEQLVTLAGSRRIAAVIVDPSAASFIETIRRGGRFRVEAANNDVLDGIRDVSTQLRQENIFINDCCTDCIREFGLYRWDEKSPVDKPMKADDHAMDDVRYFVRAVFAPSRFSFK